MAVVNVAGIRAQSRTNLQVPWAEYIGNTGSTQDASYSVDGSRIAMQIVVNSSQVELAASQAIGWATLSPNIFDRETMEGATFRTRNLIRRNPMAHPRYEGFFCTAVTSVKGYSPTAPYKLLRAWGPEAVTRYSIMTLRFERLPYRVETSPWTVAGLDANQFQRNWEFYTSEDFAPSAQMITRRGGQFRYNDGGAGAGSPEGVEIAGPIGTKIAKMKYYKTWHRVPSRVIFDANGLPARFMSLSFASDNVMLGSVNRNDIFGCLPGTLLLEGVEIRRHATPYLLSTPVYRIPFGHHSEYDVTLHMEYFDPPRGIDRNTGNRIFERGHNLVPWARDNLWYPAETIRVVPPLIVGDPAVRLPIFLNNYFEEMFQPIP